MKTVITCCKSWISSTDVKQILSGGIGVKIPEVVNSVVGLKSADGDIESAVARRISRNSNQLLQLEASRYN